jgi:Transposase DDE domain group 1
MVHDDAAVGLDGVEVVFDDERLVSDAGIGLVATLAGRLGIETLAGRLVRLRGDRPGAANAGRKVMALLYAMLLGADCIDDCELLRAGRTRRLLGGWLPAPSTLGTFLRAFTFGHVRQLDRLLAETLTRAWQAGAGPGDGRLLVDVDSFIGEVCGYKEQGASFGYTKRRGYHPLMASRADTGEVLHVRLRKGKANSSRGVLRFAEELIARVAPPSACDVCLFGALYSYETNRVSLGVADLQLRVAPEAGVRIRRGSLPLRTNLRRRAELASRDCLRAKTGTRASTRRSVGSLIIPRHIGCSVRIRWRSCRRHRRS